MSKFQTGNKYSTWTDYGLTKDSKGRLSTSEPSTGKRDGGVLKKGEEVTYLGKKEVGFEKEHAFRLADGRVARVHPNHIFPDAKYNTTKALVAARKQAASAAVIASVPQAGVPVQEAQAPVAETPEPVAETPAQEGRPSGEMEPKEMTDDEIIEAELRKMEEEERQQAEA